MESSGRGQSTQGSNRLTLRTGLERAGGGDVHGGRAWAQRRLRAGCDHWAGGLEEAKSKPGEYLCQI